MGGGFLEGLGFVVNAYGESEAAGKQAQALGQQASAAQKNAWFARQKAQADAENQVIQSRAILAKQSADFSAGNLEGGSVFSVMAESATNAEMDRLNILFSGKIKSDQYTAEMNSKMAEGKDLLKASIYKVLGSGFQSAGKASS